jgi:hypothetical protein
MAYEHKQHKVIIKQVVEGVLNTAEYDFKTYEDAFNFVQNTTADTKLIYNSDDELIWSNTN